MELQDGIFVCSLGDSIFPLDMSEPLSVLLDRLKGYGQATMYMEPRSGANVVEEKERREVERKDEDLQEKTQSPTTILKSTLAIPPETELTYALVPGNILQLNDAIYSINRKPEITDSCTVLILFITL